VTVRRAPRGLLLVVLAGALLSGCGDTASEADCSTYQFDREAWFADDAREGFSSPRRVEFSSLDRCGVLPDRTRREVRRMLGPPAFSSPREWNYRLARTGFSGLELYVIFDERGRVEEVYAEDN
jgi:hypothetical protein